MNLPPELCLDIPEVDNNVDLPNYSDAMEYILDTELVSTRCCSVLETDAMDTICSFPSVVGMDSEPVKFFGFEGVPLLVETPTPDAMTQITGYTEPEPAVWTTSSRLHEPISGNVLFKGNTCSP